MQLSAHAANELHIFVALHKLRKIAVRVKRLQVIGFQLKISQFIHKLGVILETVEGPGHLTFDPDV